jgi:hypothetical protein
MAYVYGTGEGDYVDTSYASFGVTATTTDGADEVHKYEKRLFLDSGVAAV